MTINRSSLQTIENTIIWVKFFNPMITIHRHIQKIKINHKRKTMEIIRVYIQQKIK